MTDPQSHLAGAQGFLERPLKFVALLGGAVLFGIMVLVTTTVFFRYVLNQPILGDQELVEIGMSLVVMMAIPFATYQGAHIRVDILDKHIGAAGRFWGDIMARLIAAMVLALLVQKTWAKTLDAYEYEDVTNMIELPIWIPYGAITLGMALYILVIALQLVDQVRRGKAKHE